MKSKIGFILSSLPLVVVLNVAHATVIEENLGVVSPMDSLSQQDIPDILGEFAQDEIIPLEQQELEGYIGKRARGKMRRRPRGTGG